jgi:hypothetical protein
MSGTGQPTTIEIFVDAHGTLRYSDGGVSKVGRGEQVRWTCAAHDYGIQFANNGSPFKPEVVSLSGSKGQHTELCTVKPRTVTEPPRRHFFKYTVSVHIPGGAKPIVIDDPVIIVDDG